MPAPTRTRDIARDLLNQYASVEKAATALERMAEQDAHLHKDITDHALHDLCLLLVRQVASQQRKSTWQQAMEDNDNPPTAADLVERQLRRQALSNNIAVGLLDGFYLPSGKRLGDAVASDLDAAIRVYRGRAKTMTERHDFLVMIRQRVTDDKSSVRMLLSETDVASIQAGALL